MLKLDLTGKTFGRLTIINEVESINKRRRWLCKCSCGNEKKIYQSHITSRKKPIRSCGCLLKEYQKKSFKRKIPKEKLCLVCGKKIEYLSQSGPKTCSKECRKIYRSQRDRVYNHSSLEIKLKHEVQSIQSRCRNNNIPCDIDTDYVLSLLKSQNNKCSRTGFTFIINDGGKERKRHPHQPSLDRIIPELGYTKGNVQLVCLMYNLCKNIWSDEEVKQFAKAIRDYE